MCTINRCSAGLQEKVMNIQSFKLQIMVSNKESKKNEKPLVPYNAVESAQCLISLKWLIACFSVDFDLNSSLSCRQANLIDKTMHCFNGYYMEVIWKQISFHKRDPEDLCLPNPLIMFSDSATHWSKTQSFAKEKERKGRPL